jgi:hypothetical protein
MTGTKSALCQPFACEANNGKGYISAVGIIAGSSEMLIANGQLSYFGYGFLVCHDLLFLYNTKHGCV